MAWRIVLQPNGLLARFSDIVDDFTHMNMTEAEALEACREYLGVDDAKKKVAAGKADLNFCNEPGGTLWRWSDSMRRIQSVHGRRVATKRYNEGNKKVEKVKK